MDNQNLTLKLPDILKDSYYEDYVAAILNAGGYYLQRSIHKYRDGIELLELDVVATKILPDRAKNTVIEIKSGGWGLRDVFKVYGWLKYLELKNADGAFVFQSETSEHDYDILKKVSEEMDIKLIRNQRKDDKTLNDDCLKESFDIDLTGIPDSVIQTLRYSYNLERVMLDYILEYSNAHSNLITPRKTYNYLRELNNTSFIHKNPLSRLKFLSDLSKDNSYIASFLDNEINGVDISSIGDHPKFKSSYYDIFFPKTSDITPVYVAIHATLLNKLHVLKSIVEYLVTTDAENMNEFQSFLDRLSFNSLNKRGLRVDLRYEGQFEDRVVRVT